MKWNKFIIVVIILLIFISGCSCKKENDNEVLYEGMVVDKIFDEGRTIVTYHRVNGHNIPIYTIISDKWYVVIYNDEKIQKHQVRCDYYESLQIGDYINMEGEIVE